ncbi:hypothetical protein DOTSEDRAFT_139126 [Dothistroma septosporum NZE10]|uniref:Rhodopsin domain-containing protein n=1 Tax=Dothistroma septosporum (strain NZE10 / CBS 128990) TaxID=675120 RepID=M2YK63_DOTSN|nr:hypothetical protein DOTSEDRAFT_139126 [Dothistroma septosporum NZE10]
MTHHTPGNAVVVSIWCLASLAILAVACRLYARFWLVRNGGIDDWTVAVSLVFALGMTVEITQQVHYGLGKPSSQVADIDAENLMKSLWAAIWLYHLAIGFARLSIILQCMRVFPQADPRRTRWLVLYVMMAINTSLQIWGFFSTVFFCKPIDAYWKTIMSDEFCLGRKVVWLFNSSMGMALNISVAVLPLPWIKQMRLPKRQKLMLMGVFVLAGLPCLLAIIRVQSLIQVATSHDPAYDNATLAIFSANEVYVGIVCACLPVMKAFFVRLAPRVTNIAPANKVRDMASWVKGLKRRRRSDTVHLTSVGNTQDHDHRWTSKSALIGTSNSSPQQTTDDTGVIHVECIVEQKVEITKPAKAADITNGTGSSQDDSLWQMNQWDAEAGIQGMKSFAQSTSTTSTSHNRATSRTAISSDYGARGSQDRSGSRQRGSRG